VLTQNPANCCDGKAGEPLAQRHTSPPYSDSAEIRVGAASRRRCRTVAHRVQAYPNVDVSPGEWHGFRRGDCHNRGGPDSLFADWCRPINSLALSLQVRPAARRHWRLPLSFCEAPPI
jgi:hypothetical protein